ncbi:hypothetical protein AWB78_07832 [Caballeronia calidae]|uniref:Uncharacterized protein n=1 Tax=Caballeronia calidae TaxID=1777139 RepID=A0A158EGK6_9BURK|nr:hypothetical protein [Caballeronia calidae]SAL06019.1 hypothetical protein AWB78_07832 [Caballeronia calidae]
MSGILAIWNDCTEGREAAYEHWYQHEHLPERLGIPGFRVGRRYEAIDARLRFLTAYEVDHLDVLGSKEYRQRLENPTEQTTAIVKNGFVNMSRTVCARSQIRGDIRGSIVVTATLREGDPTSWFDSLESSRYFSDGATHSEIWLSSENSDARTKEELLRGRDAKIVACLYLEYLRKEPAIQSAQELRRIHPNADIGVYQLMCSLTRSE